jgi:hypothetical protein
MRMRRIVLFLIAAAGCASTTPLDPIVMSYDNSTAASVTKLLLLNIARARHNEPMHFTTVSNIVATYRFTVSGGVVPAATGDRGWLPVPQLGGTSEENPTVSISPMQGDEFTQRLLTPFPEQKLTLLLRQGYDVDSLFRLLGAEILIASSDGSSIAYQNRPSDKAGYTMFRRLVAHMSSIQDRHSLYVEPLQFQLLWTQPAATVTPETFQATYKEFQLAYDPDAQIYRVSKRVSGHVMITNYDPMVLSNEERVRLHEKAEAAPFNDILVDIRSGFPGGDYPIQGRLRLRSFHEVLTFIGRGVEEEPEFDVAPDPRTPHISENPARTLDIVEAKHLPPGSGVSVSYHGLGYALREDKGYQWNRKAFSLLYELYQMSTATVTSAGPAITIAK